MAEARLDSLLRNLNETTREYQTLQIHAKTLEIALEEERKKTDMLSRAIEAKNARIAELESSEPKYGNLDFPKFDSKEFEKTLKACHQFTIGVIADYLRLDRFELVKNLAKVTDSSNAATVIAFRDGALSRIESLISVLDKFRKETSYKDRMEGSVK